MHVKGVEKPEGTPPTPAINNYCERRTASGVEISWAIARTRATKGEAIKLARGEGLYGSRGRAASSLNCRWRGKPGRWSGNWQGAGASFALTVRGQVPGQPANQPTTQGDGAEGALPQSKFVNG